MRQHRLPAIRTAACALAVGTVLFAGGQPSAAANREIDPASVKGVVVQGLHGEFNVVIGNTPEVRVSIEGDDADAVDMVDVEVKDEALLITIPNSSTNIAAVDGNVTVITSSGGNSHVQIGNQTFDSEPAELQMTATVPEGTIIQVLGLVGETEIGDTGADVVLSCASCDAKLGKIAAFDVNVAGSGKISAERIDRALVAKISGDGHIGIADGDLEQASLQVVGAGNIDFRGRTVDATAKIVGAGAIHVREVDNQIRSTVVGAGDVTTGN